MKRTHYLLAISLILTLLLAARLFFSSHDRVTLDVEKMPLGELVKKIEAQTRISIVTNADPATPVTVKFRRVPLVRALNAVASLIGASPSYLAYYFAASKSEIDSEISRFESEFHTGFSDNGPWKAYFLPVPQPPASPERGGVPPPPHAMAWRTPGAEPNLQAFLQKAAARQSVCFQFPDNFNPSIKTVPEKGTIRKAADKIATLINGAFQESYVLRMTPQMPPEEGQANRPPEDFPRWAEQPSGSLMQYLREEVNQRMEEHAASLPAGEAAKARKVAKKMSDFRDKMETLPEEMRQQAHAEFLQDPDNLSMILEQGGKWADSASIDERKSYYSSYANRKASTNGESSSSGGGGGASGTPGLPAQGGGPEF